MPILKTVIVVDDEATMRMSFKYILQEHFRVVAFARGTEAIRYVQDNPREAYAAFVDYIMPDDLNGNEVCIALRNIDDKISLVGISGTDNAYFAGPLFAQMSKKYFSVEKVLETAMSAVAVAEERREARG